MESPGAKPCTKRTILANIAQIFDPLGLLGPVILTAKIMIQRLWRLQIDWDESLPADIYTEWASYVLSMQALDGFSVQRKVITNGSNVQLDLHGFCDASERAYGACIYIRSSSSHEILQAQLICSKSRVAPLKTISIPRLELCGAQSLTQLMGQVKAALELHVGRTYYWTDSSIVLSWIKAVDKKLPVFVAHRVGEIQEMTTMEDWNHVGTKENPADLVSRGVTPDELKNSQLWWNGPLWLQDENLIKEKVKIPEIDENAILECASRTILAMPAQRDNNPFERFSTFGRMVRVAAVCLRFVQLCKREGDKRNYGPISADELDHARKCLIRRQQQLAFPDEIGSLRQGRPLSVKSSLLQLNPFLDQEDLLRVGGRLHRADLPQDAKHPVILPHHRQLTELIIKYEHTRNLHSGTDATMAAVRSQYWPLRARGTVRRLLQQCIVCFKARPRVSEQIMGNLPAQRVTAARPFSNVRVDFCGPIYVREGTRRNSKHIKTYVAVFVCMATKAVHLELVSNMTTDAFLNSFKRFIDRREKPTDVFSDNGTNFVGANHQLEELRLIFGQEQQQQKIIEATAAERIKWHFIPPRAPHFGGLWEGPLNRLKTTSTRCQLERR